MASYKYIKKVIPTVLICFGLMLPSLALAINITVPSATSWGQVLRGNANGTYSPVATSTLGIGSSISQLGQIGDVSTTTPMNYGDMLRYSTATNKWESVATSTLGLQSTLSLPLSLANGGTATTTFFSGGLVFGSSTDSGLLSQSSNIFWSDSNNRLGIGTNAPRQALNVAVGTTPEALALIDTSPGIVLYYAASGAFFTVRNTTADSQFSMGISATGAAFLGSLTDHAFSLRANNVNAISISHDATGIGLFMGATVSFNYSVSLGGNSVRSMGMERHTTADTAGNSYTILSGGATSGATNRNGGDLILKSGISTGSGTSKMSFYTFPGTAAATSDNTALERLTILGNGYVGVGSTTPFAKLSINPVAGEGHSFVIGSSTKTNFVITSTGHHLTGGVIPSVSSCGTSPSITGDDQTMRVKAGSGGPFSTCLVTFANPWLNSVGTQITPICHAEEDTTGTIHTIVASSTPTTITLTHSAASLNDEVVTVMCRASDNFTY